MNLPQLELPKILYHYTSIEAFYNIIKSKTIRLHTYLGTNDSAEYVACDQWIKEELEILEQNIDDPKIKELLKTSSQTFTLNKPNAFHTYEPLSFSFSEHPDLLTQWIRYSKDTRGICIGFDPNRLGVSFNRAVGANASNDPSQSRSGFKVDYLNKKECQQKVKEIYDYFARNNINNYFDDLIHPLLQLSWQHKDPSFKEEEWRICELIMPKRLNIDAIGSAKHVRFDIKGDTLLKYTELAIDPMLAIQEIWITPNFKNSRTFEDFLNYQNITAEIQTYQTTYRPK
jgi:hypothetical protein